MTLVLAACAAMTHRGEIGNRAARGFNASAHVAKEATAPYRGPVYIGQSLDGIPATVIAQSDHGGITVLAAFASPQMSLRRHLETIASLESYARLQVSICASLFFGARSLCGHR